MANYHTNHLVIAADEANMHKVLTRIAENLDANRDTTEFDIAYTVGVRTVGQLYDEVVSYIISWYWLCFAGAPIDPKVMDAGAETWGVHEENQQYISAVTNALGSVTRNSGKGVSINLSLAPSARPLSDEASVSCDEYGEHWVLTINYSTAWQPNSDDLNLFFMGLPKGEYGIAFLDADEYDDYESVNVFGGIHAGAGGMRAAQIKRDETTHRADLALERTSLSEADKSQLIDLAELALNVAICSWTEFGWDEDEDSYADDVGDSSYLESGILAPWGATLHWTHPKGTEYERIDEAILVVLKRFPWVVGSTGAAYEGREKNVERLIPGQPIKLVADWANPYFDPVAIQTQLASGERLGNLDDRGGGMQLSDNARAALACILPHVRAYADEVEPLMTIWDGHKRNSTVIVRLELTDEPLDNILDEVHALLKKASNRRGVSSVVEEG